MMLEKIFLMGTIYTWEPRQVSPKKSDIEGNLITLDLERAEKIFDLIKQENLGEKGFQD